MELCRNRFVIFKVRNLKVKKFSLIFFSAGAIDAILIFISNENICSFIKIALTKLSFIVNSISLGSDGDIRDP